jgi:hypothetical protein
VMKSVNDYNSKRVKKQNHVMFEGSHLDYK